MLGVLSASQDVIESYNKSLSTMVAQTFRTLLENGHLYQSQTTDDDSVRKLIRSRIEERALPYIEQRGYLNHGSEHSLWHLPNDLDSAVENAAGTFVLFVHPSHAKLFCKTCDRQEAFNLNSARSVIDTVPGHIEGRTKQVYVLSYRCQSCRGIPEVFLVRRNGAKLTLTGRSPMEHVTVPSQIPKDIQRYYSGAVVAYQSGQALSGLFMLRTLCEQWARKFAGPTDRADACIEKYMESLPLNFKSQFPSWKRIYEGLSADIHAATGSEKLFTKTKDEVDEHFDARRIFKIDDPAPPVT
jgi:hypothetical protein